MKLNKTITYKGYVVIQNAFNHHISIYDEKGMRVMHTCHDKEKTNDELKDCVDMYLTLTESMGTYLEKIGVE